MNELYHFNKKRDISHELPKKRVWFYFRSSQNVMSLYKHGFKHETRRWKKRVIFVKQLALVEDK